MPSGRISTSLDRSVRVWDLPTGACVDWLADALLTLAEKPPLEGNWYDAKGELRVWMPTVRIERLIKLAREMASRL